MRRKIAREYMQRSLIIQLLPFMAIMCVSFLLEFIHSPVDMVTYETDPMALMMKRMLPLMLLGVKALLSAVPLWVASTIVMRLGTRFVNDLYGLEEKQAAEEESDAFRQFMFGGAADAKASDEPPDFEAYDNVFQRDMLGPSGLALRPILIVRGGDIAVGAGGRLDVVGGPGLLVVHSDSAVVLEKGGRLTRVVGPNTHIEGLSTGLCMLERFERVWGVIDLRPQHWPMRVNGMTKEGIPVSCDARISFRIDDRLSVGADGTVRREEPTAKKPHSYTDDAVLKAATGLWVRIRQKNHAEQVRKWTGRVMIGEVEGTLRNILAQYRLDWLVHPPPSDDEAAPVDYRSPREKVREQLEARLREAFKVGNPLGAQILDVALGEIDVRSDVISKQWVKVWQVGWEQRAMESLAEGEAELSRLEAAQVQAQAEMVLLLTDAIRPLTRDVGDFPPYLYAMRLVQTLRWMAYDPAKMMFLPPEMLRELDELEGTLKLEYGEDVTETLARRGASEEWMELQRRLLSGRMR